MNQAASIVNILCLLFTINIAVLEEQKSGIQKEAVDLRTSLREVEKARMDARRELQDMRRTVKMLDSERSKLSVRINELLGQVARDEEKEEEARKENFSLKQKVHSIRNFYFLLSDIDIVLSAVQLSYAFDTYLRCKINVRYLLTLNLNVDLFTIQ